MHAYTPDELHSIAIGEINKTYVDIATCQYML